jgi:urease accessory protein
MDTNISNLKNNFDYHQLLLSWFSPAFPIGSYNFSHGIEAAIEMNFINNANNLKTWICHIITFGSGKTDCILLTNAYKDQNVNELAFSLCSSKERWIETKQLGKAFCKNIKENWGYNIENNLAYPVAVGVAGLHFKIPLEQLLVTYLQNFVANLVNIGVKHIPLGQSAGQKILIELIPIIKDQALLYKKCEINDIGNSSFISDLASMYHETLKNRIYQT